MPTPEHKGRAIQLIREVLLERGIPAEKHGEHEEGAWKHVLADTEMTALQRRKDIENPHVQDYIRDRVRHYLDMQARGIDFDSNMRMDRTAQKHYANQKPGPESRSKGSREMGPIRKMPRIREN